MSDPVNPTNNPNPGTEDPKPSGVDYEAEIARLKTENEKLRKTNTEASADASKRKKEAEEWREKYQSTLSEADRVKAEQEEAAAAMQEKLVRLETNERKAVLASIGFEAEAAEAFSDAFKNNDFDGLVEGIRKFIDVHDKALKETMIQENPRINSTGNTGKVRTKEEIMAIKDTVERQQAIAENFELFTT